MDESVRIWGFELNKRLEIRMSCWKVCLKHEETLGKVSWELEVILVWWINVCKYNLGRITWDRVGSKSWELVGIRRPFGVYSLYFWRLGLMALGEFGWEIVEN